MANPKCLLLLLLLLLILPACSDKKSDTEKAAGKLNDRLSDALRFEGGEKKDGDPPEGKDLPEAPKINSIDAPARIYPGSAFKVTLETDYERPLDVDKAIVRVLGASAYIVVTKQLVEVLDGWRMELKGVLEEDMLLAGHGFTLEYALQTKDGVTGAYVSRVLEIPAEKEEPECDDGPCCNGGEWVDEGGECAVGDELSCTEDLCTAEHGCESTLAEGRCLIGGVCYKADDLNPVNDCEGCQPETGAETWSALPDETPCVYGNAADSGLCMEGVCEPVETDGDYDLDPEPDPEPEPEPEPEPDPEPEPEIEPEPEPEAEPEIEPEAEYETEPESEPVNACNDPACLVDGEFPGATSTDARGLEWIEIPGGCFCMGCSLGDQECVANESPPHTVQISGGVEIMPKEVTNTDYAAFLTENGNDCDGHDCVFVASTYPKMSESGGDWTADAGYETHPVTMPTWYGAKNFCEWAGGRLPSESEWEYAARAGMAVRYYCGHDAACLDAVAWYNPSAVGEAMPVGGKTENDFGLSDMLGNVWEWTEDCWHATYDGAPSVGGVWAGGDCGLRALRGGSLSDAASTLRVSHRYNSSPANYGNNVGFRCIREMQAPDGDMDLDPEPELEPEAELEPEVEPEPDGDE